MLVWSRAVGALRCAPSVLPALLVALEACGAESSDLFSNKPDPSGSAGAPSGNEGGTAEGSGGTPPAETGGTVSAGGTSATGGAEAGGVGAGGTQGGDAGGPSIGGSGGEGASGGEPVGSGGARTEGGAPVVMGGEGGGGEAAGGAATAGVGGVGPGCEDDCDDGNPCTDDGCDPESGCVSEPNAEPCDDGDVCTTGDVCAERECAGSPLDCDDGNPCTLDSCAAETGCASVPACDDGNGCTEDHCDDSGVCSNTPGGLAEDDSEQSIPDGLFACEEPNEPVSAELVLDDPGVIAALRVTLDLEHPFLGDLVARLEHVETGTVVELLNREGPGTFGSRATLDGLYTLADGGDAWPNMGAAESGTFEPSEPLAAFVGESIAGSWQLEIGDGCEEYLGSLRGWSLSLGTACESEELECAGACDGASCVALECE